MLSSFCQVNIFAVLHNMEHICDGYLLKNSVFTCILVMISDMIVYVRNHFHLPSGSLHRLFKEYAQYFLFIAVT